MKKTKGFSGILEKRIFNLIFPKKFGETRDIKGFSGFVWDLKDNFVYQDQKAHQIREVPKISEPLQVF